MQRNAISRLSVTPKQHQQEAVAATIDAFQHHAKVKVILPCGTGKTLIGELVDDALDAKCTVAFLPSIALIKQTLEAYREHDAVRSRKLICVCSDNTVASADTAQITEDDLGVHISTSSEEVKRTLTGLTHGVLIFCTYRSANVLGDALPSGFEFDFGVFDEAHRTASSNDGSYSYALLDERMPIKRRLFMTATPRHVAGGDDDSSFSMDNESIYGPTAYALSITEARERGLIVETPVIVSAVNSADIMKRMGAKGKSNVQARNIAAATALSKALRDYNATKVFSFHATVEAAAKFANDPNVQAILGCEVLHINGMMSATERQKIIDRFAAAERAVITNARCLTEGIDVPAVDMVMFSDPKRSVTDIVQAVGRAQRLSPGKKRGYVLIGCPIYTNENGETVVEDSQLSGIFTVLSRMTEQESVIAYASHPTRREITEARKKPIPFTVIGDDADVTAIREAVEVYYASSLRSPWEDNYEILREYWQKTGDANPVAGELPELATWLRHTRRHYAEGKLSEDRVKLLNDINFIWNGRMAAWEKNYARWIAGEKMTLWIRDQREAWRNGKLDPELQERLATAGFVFDHTAEKKNAAAREFCQGWLDALSKNCGTIQPGAHSMLMLANGLDPSSHFAGLGIEMFFESLLKGKSISDCATAGLIAAKRQSQFLPWVKVTRIAEGGHLVHQQGLVSMVELTNCTSPQKIRNAPVIHADELVDIDIETVAQRLAELPVLNGYRLVTVDSEPELWLISAWYVGAATYINNAGWRRLSGNTRQGAEQAKRLALSVELTSGNILKWDSRLALDHDNIQSERGV